MARKYNVSNNWKKSFSIVLFILILIVSFVLINITSGVLFGNYKTDLTQDKRYSFSTKTIEVLDNLSSPINVRVYVSPELSKEYPLYAQYAQFVLRFMEQYRKYSDNKIQVEVINPQPFSNDEEDAKRYGLKSFKGANDSENYFFGAVFSNAVGENYVIPYFFSLRKNYLENDVTRAITHLTNLKQKTVGIVSADIPVINQTYIGVKEAKDWAFINLLKKDYNLVQITSAAAEIPYEVDTLILITSQELSPIFLYALDQYIMRGGRVLIFIDPNSEVEKDSKKFINLKGSNLNMLLAHWGINYQEDIVIGDRNLAVDATIDNENTGSRSKRYPLWMNLTTKYLNEEHPLTYGLNKILLKTPGFFVLKNTPGITNTPLMITSDQTVVVDAQITKFGTRDEILDYLDDQNSWHILSVLSEGNYKSAFKSNPLEGTEVGDKLLPYISSSLVPTKIIVTADTDLLYSQNWAHLDYDNADDSSEIIPINNNFDFIQRAVDFLSDNHNMLSIGDKNIADRSITLYSKIHNDIYQKHEKEYNELTKTLERNIIALNTSLRMLDNQELSTSVKTLNDINNLKRNLQQSQEDLRRFEHILNAKVQERLDKIITMNTLVFPVIIILLFIIVRIYIHRRNSKKARRLLDE